MYKPTKLEQEYWKHKTKYHRLHPGPCHKCLEILKKIEKDSKQLA